MRTLINSTSRGMILRRTPISLMTLALLAAPGVSSAELEMPDFMRQAVDNAEYTFKADMNAFPDKPTSNNANQDEFHLLLRQEMKSNFSLSENTSVEYTLKAGASSQPKEYRGAFNGPRTRDLEANYLDFNRLNMVSLGDEHTLVLGKEIIEGGFAELYSPTDRFGLADGKRPMAPEKMGVWQMSLEYFVGDDTLTATAIPFHQRSLVPSGRSRWAGSSGDSSFTSLALPVGAAGAAGTTIEDDYHAPAASNWGYLIEYSGVRDGYDYFWLAHHGPSIYPVLTQEDATVATYQKEDPMSWNYGGGVSAVIDEWKLYAEGIYQHSEEGKDENFIRYTLGFSYRETEYANSIGWMEFKPILEFSGDETTASANDPETVVNSSDARPFHNSLGFRVEMMKNDDWSFAPAFTYNFEGEDWTAGLGAQYKFDDNTKLRIVGAVFEGKDDTYYGRWRDNDNIQVGIEHKF